MSNFSIYTQDQALQREIDVNRSSISTLEANAAATQTTGDTVVLATTDGGATGTCSTNCYHDDRQNKWGKSDYPIV